MVFLADAMLDFWLTEGRYTAMFQRDFAKVLGLRASLVVNSGSSANLVALSALTSRTLADRALQPGDEVITVAAGFPTTVNPILQNGLVPVFVDIELPHYNAIPSAIEAAIGPKTKAIILAHTLGSPFDAAALSRLARNHGLWLIEDCCDALGSKIGDKNAGTFGDIATFSFYPAHHITMGEGGAVATDNLDLKRIMESFRDWGRDCWCPTGTDNTCGKRFDWKLGELPAGYDHKYTYSHAGYNLKATDLQAAVGLAQLPRLSEFVSARRRNFNRLHVGLKGLEEFLILPAGLAGTVPSWFGFPLTVRSGRNFNREMLTRFLESKKIATRLLFGGNLIKQPYFAGRNYRVAGSLSCTDIVMRDAFWIGVYPGLTDEMIDFVVEQIHSFFSVR